ncbi:MAG: hypothetical protein JXR83_17905 [Deltaproteobacteria bacterium]|nr:hypothetical protein [Deltaproteobacteria bacterium]
MRAILHGTGQTIALLVALGALAAGCCDCGDLFGDGGSADSSTQWVDGGPVDGAAADGHQFPPCGPSELCENDSRCVEGHCVPWQPGEYDEECVQRAVSGSVRPQLQCVWSSPPAGDLAPTFNRVLHTPLVATLGIELGPDIPLRPNIVFISDATYTEGTARGCEAAGTLRVLDGATCREVASATAVEDRTNSSVTPAIGDLDGDGRPEIVAAAAAGGVIAFAWDGSLGRLQRLWYSHLSDGSADLHRGDACLWGGVSLVDLDDDGLPEVLFDGAVWSPAGERIATVPGWLGFGTGVQAVVADVDLDGTLELAHGEGVWQWSGTGFVLESYFTGAGAQGYSALADFGDFAGALGDAPGRPEVVLAGGGHIRVMSIGGTVVRDFAAPSAGGGPPTVADYDGDGVPEIGAAFSDHYVVYDVADQALLWQQASQDHSSSRTGSSVFDFNADGRAEVVYGDECYVRVYDGVTGEVLFSQARFSSTWEENPIVADVDGDYAAEMVMGMSGNCNPTYCGEWDPLFAGLRCEDGSDCVSGNCDSGFCRCTEDAQCGDTYGCTATLAHTPGTGNVCRARHFDCRPGLRVYRDGRDLWAASRPIWNQHAYHITNVGDDGTVPHSSALLRNWQQPGLNNFRMNTQGDLTDVPKPDLTVGELQAECVDPQHTHLSAQFCNRGAALSDWDIEVVFRQVNGEELCRLRTSEPVPPGTCVRVECDSSVPPFGDFEAVVDPDGRVTECLEQNNRAQAYVQCSG